MVSVSQVYCRLPCYMYMYVLSFFSASPATEQDPRQLKLEARETGNKTYKQNLPACKGVGGWGGVNMRWVLCHHLDTHSYDKDREISISAKDKQHTPPPHTQPTQTRQLTFTWTQTKSLNGQLHCVRTANLCRKKSNDVEFTLQ